MKFRVGADLGETTIYYYNFPGENNIVRLFLLVQIAFINKAPTQELYS